MTADEALVLFGLLSRFDEGGALSVEDQAEERTLWNIHCLLEKQLVDVLRPDYASLLASARDRLRDMPLE